MALSDLETEVIRECLRIERQLTVDTLLDEAGIIHKDLSGNRDPPISRYARSMRNLVSKFKNKYCKEEVERVVKKFSLVYNYC